jgi:hypothetical protein
VEGNTLKVQEPIRAAYKHCHFYLREDLHKNKKIKKEACLA